MNNEEKEICEENSFTSFCLGIADRVFEVRAEVSRVPAKYNPYMLRTDAKPDYHIKITQEAMGRQAKRRRPSSEHSCTMDFQTTGIEFPFSFLIQDKVSRLLLREGVLFFHGSAVCCRGKAYIFSAPSKVGKSTHAKLWMELFGDETRMINDDKVLLRLPEENDFEKIDREAAEAGSDVIVYGTPWRGKHNIGENLKAPLGGICFLSQGLENSIRRLYDPISYYHLFNQVYGSDNPEDAGRIAELIGKLSKLVPVYYLSNNAQPEAAYLSYGAMTGRGRE